MAERRVLPRWAMVALVVATVIVTYNAASADSWGDRVILIACALVLASFVVVQAIRQLGRGSERGRSR